MEGVSDQLALALGCVEAGDLEAAEEAYAEAVGLAEGAYGEYSEVTASCLCHLARTARRQGGDKLEMAATFFEKALFIREAIYRNSGGAAASRKRTPDDRPTARAVGDAAAPRANLGIDGISVGPFTIAANHMELAEACGFFLLSL
mmetsp:Transcript_22294/g.68783  ORF Transcript_22294/g.68783 Transcript_22294/m.68783 type:complete len:146 (-) Transcript_22294:416-853(-)